VFDHISKHLEVHQKHSASRRIFNSLLGVWKCDQTRSFVFDILLPHRYHCFDDPKFFRIERASISITWNLSSTILGLSESVTERDGGMWPSRIRGRLYDVENTAVCDAMVGPCNGRVGVVKRMGHREGTRELMEGLCRDVFRSICHFKENDNTLKLTWVSGLS